MAKRQAKQGGGGRRGKPRGGRARRAGAGPTMEQLKQYVRQQGTAYLESPNINSVGIGLKIDTRRGQTDEVCIQFTVDRKASPELLEGLRTRLIPPLVNVDGHLVPTDVVERRFEPSYTLVAERVARKEQRKLRQDVLRPGISIAHPTGTAGTLGAIVYDRRTNQELMLSNWHVFHGALAAIGDAVVQPGPHDDNRVEANRCGALVRSHLGAAGDCAVASIEGRLARPEILDLDVAPLRVGRAELKDVVVKSGRTTGVTFGRVSRIEVQSKIDYDGEEVIVGCFEISVDPKRKPPDGEVSAGGDSGASWLAVDRNGKTTDVLLGLHFAGEAAEDAREYALACYAHSVLEKLEVSLRPDADGASPGAVAEADRFGGAGYDAGFLGETIPLPRPRQSIANDIVGADGAKVAHYTHFSLAMRRSRRLAAFVAWNIDGSNITKPSNKSASWALDDRVPDDAQVGPVLYDATVFDKGHIAKREDLLWGGKTVAKRANDDSFCYTNATPQHEQFNRLAPALWKSLEDELFGQVDVKDYRVSVFGGPIFRAGDRKFSPSGAPAGFKPIGIPREYYKIVAYVDEEDEELKAHAFRLSQADLIAGALEAVQPEALDLQEFRMYQVAVSELEALTHIDFGVLKDYDTVVSGPGPEAVARRRRVTTFADIRTR